MLQLRCTSATAPLQLPLQLRSGSIALPLQLRYSFRYSSVTVPLQVRYMSVIQLLLLLRLRYSFPYSIDTAGSAPLQPSDTAPVQLRDIYVSAPLLSVTVSVISPVTGAPRLRFSVWGKGFRVQGLKLFIVDRLCGLLDCG